MYHFYVQLGQVFSKLVKMKKTLNMTFKLQFHITESITCNVEPKLKYGQKLKDVQIIILDGISSLIVFFKTRNEKNRFSDKTLVATKNSGKHYQLYEIVVVQKLLRI